MGESQQGTIAPLVLPLQNARQSEAVSWLLQRQMQQHALGCPLGAHMIYSQLEMGGKSFSLLGSLFS